MAYKRKRVTKSKPKYAKKARTVKKKAYRRKKSYPRDSTVTRINPGKAKVVKVIRGYQPTPPNTNATDGVNAFQVAVSSNSNVITTVDPSGSWGAFSGNGTVIPRGPAKIPGWDAYKGLYQKYKVTKVTLKWSAYDGSSSLDDATPTLHVRYNDDYTASAPNWTDVATERGWIKKQFTPEHPNFTYSFYPKVMKLVDNVNILATEARAPVPMPWTDVDTPVELYGFKCLVNNSGSATTRVNCDITYTILFKEAE